MNYDLTELQKYTLEVISMHNKKNPIISKDIANRIGLKILSTGKEGADMRSVINALRTKGYPICADGDGYYFPKTDSELQEFIDSFAGRIEKQVKALDGMRLSFPQIKANRERLEKIKSGALDQDSKVQFKNSDGYVDYYVVEGKERPHGVAFFRATGFMECDCESFRYSASKSCKHTILVSKFRKTEIEIEASKNQQSLII